MLEGIRDLQIKTKKIIMGCFCGSPTPVELSCFQPSIEERVQGLRLELKGNIKKILKLMVKQYEIESIVQYAHEHQMDDDFKQPRQPMYIRYYNRYDPETVFEWKIDPDEFKIY